MIGAAFRVMALTLLRDRAALVMAFVLPTVIFAIFAAIFSGAVRRPHPHPSGTGGSGGDARHRAPRLGARGRHELARHAAARRPRRRNGGGARGRGRRGAGAARRPRGGTLGRIRAGPPGCAGREPRQGARHPDRAGPAPAGAQRGPARRGALPHRRGRGAHRKIGPDERAFLDEAFAEQRARKEPFSFSALVERQSTAAAVGNARVSYYAGAIAAVFLLFAAMQGALSLVEERESGLADRLSAGPGGLGVIVVGKFLFLTLQGVVQAGLIFGAAALLHGVTIGPHWPAFLLTCGLVSAMAAGLALAACAGRGDAPAGASLRHLRRPAALGGRRQHGAPLPDAALAPAGRWFTPNAWAIEAFQGALGEGSAVRPGACWRRWRSPASARPSPSWPGGPHEPLPPLPHATDRRVDAGLSPRQLEPGGTPPGRSAGA